METSKTRNNLIGSEKCHHGQVCWERGGVRNRKLKVVQAAQLTEQLAKLEVGVFQTFKAFSKAEW